VAGVVSEQLEAPSSSTGTANATNTTTSFRDHVTTIIATDDVSITFQVIPLEEEVRITMTRTNVVATTVEGSTTPTVGWMGIAASPNNVMNGSTACIGGVDGATSTTPQLYDMTTGRAVDLAATQGLDNLASSFVYDDAEGTLTLTCQISLDLDEGFTFTGQTNVPTSFIVAWDDTTDQLGYHGPNNRVQNLSVILQPLEDDNTVVDDGTTPTTTEAPPLTTTQDNEDDPNTTVDDPPREGQDSNSSQLLELTSGLTLSRTVVDHEVTFVLAYEGEAWVAIAVSPTGRMVGSQSVIGLPNESEQDSTVIIYDMNGRDISGVLPADKQILTSSSIVQQDGVTTLTFTVPLETEGFFVAASGETQYLYAYGLDNELGSHERRSAFTASLEGANVAVADDPSPYYKAHGWLMALAWGLLCPLAIAASMLRNIFPSPGMFFQIHRALNSAVVIVTIVAMGLAVKATNMENLDHFNEVAHRKLGLIIVLFAVLQATNGLFRPHLPSSSLTSAQGNNDSMSDNNEKGKNGTATTESTKSTARKVWEIGHRGFGLAVLILAWVNCTTGIDQFSLKFPEEGDGTTWIVAFWSIVGGINVITLICFVALRFNK